MRDRVPSGAIQMWTPRLSIFSAAESCAMARSLAPRSTGTKPLCTRAGPQMGTRESSCFITMRSDPGTAPISAGMSSSEVWFDMTTEARPSNFSRPETMRRQLPDWKMRRQ